MLVIALGVLLQSQFDPIRAAALAEQAGRSEARAHAEAAHEQALAEKRRFAEKYEALGRAMDYFTLAYNAGKGHVWPKQEAEALAKAIQELESTATWRPLSRSGGGQRATQQVRH